MIQIITKEIHICTKLFINWDLETWANVLEVIGFVFAILGFLLSLFIKSEIKKLKTDLIFNRRIKKHSTNLGNSASKLSTCLNDYENNFLEIKTELGICITELQDLKNKIGFRESVKIRKLIFFLKKRRLKPFAKREYNRSTIFQFLTKNGKRFYETSYEDIWEIYNRILEIIRQMENIRDNRNKSI